MTRRVVVTGRGAVTPLGNDAVTTWQNLAAGRSGIGMLSTFDTDGFPVRIGGQVRGFHPDERIPAASRWRHLSRAGRFGVAAAAEAIQAARVPVGGPPRERRGVAVGASVGRPDLQLLVDTGQLRMTTGNRQLFLRQPAPASRGRYVRWMTVFAGLASGGTARPRGGLLPPADTRGGGLACLGGAGGVDAGRQPDAERGGGQKLRPFRDEARLVLARHGVGEGGREAVPEGLGPVAQAGAAALVL